MPDAFFVPKKTRKRKRNATTKTSTTTNSKSAINGKGRPGSTSSGKAKAKAKDRDEELESGGSDEDGFEGIDDMELRASDSDPNASGEEDELETPAEKRLRLAKLYLDSVKEDLGSCFVLSNFLA